MQFKIIAALVMMAIFTGGALYIRALRAEVKLIERENAALESSLSQCLSNQQLTAEVSNDYQKKVAALNRKLADIKRLRDNARCVPISTGPGRRDAATGTGEPSGSGLNSDWLIEYAAEAERYRLQLLGCQDFVNRASSRD